MGPDRRLILTASLVGAAAATSPGAQAAARGLPTPAQAALDAPDPTEGIRLWPAAPPGGDKVTVVEKVDPRSPPKGMRDRAVTGVRTPTLTVFRPAKPNGAAVLIVVGDNDVVRTEHAGELSRQIPGARLLVVPGGHGDYLGEAVASPRHTRYPELIAGWIEEFLGPA